MAMLNLAVDMDRLDKNRLKRLPVPEYVKRERVLEGWELERLREAASPNVCGLLWQRFKSDCARTSSSRLMKNGDAAWRWVVDGAGSRTDKDQGRSQDDSTQYPGS